MAEGYNGGHKGSDRGNSGGFRRGGKPGFSKGGQGGRGRRDGEGFRGKSQGGRSRDFGGDFKPRGKGDFKPRRDGDFKPRRDGEGKPFSRDGKTFSHDGQRRSWTPTGASDGGRDGFKGARKPYAKDGARGSFRGDDRGDFGKKRFDGKGGKPGFKKDDRGFDRDKPRFDRDKPRFDRERSGGPRRDGEFGGKGKPRFDRDRKPGFRKGDDRPFDREAKAEFAGGEERRSERDSRDFGGEKGGFKRDDRRGGSAPRGDRFGGRDQGRPRRNPVLSPARIAACSIGREVRERDAFVSEVIPGVLAQMEGISQEDSTFATKIARGVTATLGTLDEFIDRNLNSPDDIQDDVRDALRVSAYELLFLGKADYAAVDQGVELVCSVAPKAGGLANAVLRKMAKSAKAFPFGRPNLSLQVLARSQAFPLWLAKRLMNEMGLEKATTFMRACNADAPVHIAVNAIKGNEEEIVEVFDQAGSLLTPVDDVPGCYLVGNARVLAKSEVRALFDQGQVLVSDASAQAVAALACPDHDIEAYLEIGSGRGTKTILLQSDAVRAFGRTMPMVSVDDHGFKAEILSKRTKAYGIESVRPVKADGRKLSTLMPEASFDAVLLDAPCSGLGTLRRHPEIRWRLTESDVTSLAAVELDMLIEAAKMVKPGGMLTYATCTVLREENEQVVERFLKTKLGESFTQEAVIAPALTPKGPDAHFAVRLKRVR